MTVIHRRHHHHLLIIHRPRQQQQFPLPHHISQVHKNACVLIHHSQQQRDFRHHYVFKPASRRIYNQVQPHHVVQHVFGHRRISISIQCGSYRIRLRLHPNDYWCKILHHLFHHRPNRINVLDDDVDRRSFEFRLCSCFVHYSDLFVFLLSHSTTCVDCSLSFFFVKRCCSFSLIIK